MIFTAKDARSALASVAKVLVNACRGLFPGSQAALPDSEVKPPPPALMMSIAATRSLAWCGEIVAANANEVWVMTKTHIEGFMACHGGTNLIIIDLMRLRYIDVAGAALMKSLTILAIRSRRVQIIFTNAQPNVRHFLQAADLDQLLLEGGQ